MRHNGLVNWDSANGAPFKVERRRAGGSGSWTDESSCFTQTLDSSDTTVVNLVTTSGNPLQAGFEYRVARNLRSSDSTNVLRSDVPHKNVADDPPVADYNALTFIICDASEGDADDNGCVNFADITSILENWGLTPCLKFGDANRDGVVEFADITSVLTFWNTATSCGSCSAGLGMGKGDGFHTMDAEGEVAAASAGMPMSEALASLGYDSITAFISAISTMDEASRNAEVQALGALLNGH